VRLDPRLAEHRRVWEGKPALRSVYRDYYRRMQAALPPGRVLEIGAGGGHYRETDDAVVAIDLLATPWLDAVADAERLPFADASFAGIVLTDVLHHVADPMAFFHEAARVLAPAGRVAMLEPGITPFSWLFYNFLHPEDVDMSADPFQAVVRSDPFDSNQAIPTLLFAQSRNREAFLGRMPAFRIVERRWLSLLAYPLTGGFKTWCLIPDAMVGPTLKLEQGLLPLLGAMMAFRLLVVLERTPEGR
jgi:SAM-dependent methyltransferase